MTACSKLRAGLLKNTQCNVRMHTNTMFHLHVHVQPQSFKLVHVAGANALHALRNSTGHAMCVALSLALVDADRTKERHMKLFLNPCTLSHKRLTVLSNW